jgi:hypothetical protein
MKIVVEKFEVEKMLADYVKTSYGGQYEIRLDDEGQPDIKVRKTEEGKPEIHIGVVSVVSDSDDDAVSAWDGDIDIPF